MKLKQFWLKYLEHWVQNNGFEIFFINSRLCIITIYFNFCSTYTMYAYNKVFVNYLSENSFSDLHSFQGLELGEDTAADVTEFFAAADCSEKIKSIHH